MLIRTDLTVFFLFFGVLILVGAPFAAEDLKPSLHTLGQPGFLVIESAADSTSIFVWESEGDDTRRTLQWDQGKLVVPDTLVAERFAGHDLGVPCTAELSGSGESGQLVLRDGIYPVSEPVVLSDGRLELHLAAGELEIRGSRITYRRTFPEDPGSRSGLLLLAGMMILVVVLLRRARLKAEERTRS